MPLVLDATPGGASANSYASLADARAYYDSHLYATDEQLDDDELLAKALVMATRLLDEWWDWQGSATTLTQKLAWPRVDGWAFNYENSPYRSGLTYVTGAVIPSDVIPDELKHATAELARQLLAGDRTADSDVETQGLKALKASSIELTFRDNVVAKVIPDAVFQMVSRWGTLRNRKGVLKLVRA